MEPKCHPNGASETPWTPMSALGVMLGASGGSWDPPLSSWGALWELLGGLWEVLGEILGAFWDDF